MADFEETDTECLKLILRKTGAEANTDSFVAMAVEHIIHFHGLVDSDEIDPLTLHQYRLSKTFRDFGILWDDSYVDTYKDLLLERTLPYQGIEEILNRTF